jgi:hypothetical protein
MKKMFIVMIVAAFAVAACGGKKAAPAKPATDQKTAPAGDGMGSDMQKSGDGSTTPPTQEAPK